MILFVIMASLALCQVKAETRREVLGLRRRQAAFRPWGVPFITESMSMCLLMSRDSTAAAMEAPAPANVVLRATLAAR